MSIFDISAKSSGTSQDQISPFTRNFQGKIRILSANYCYLKDWNLNNLEAPFWRLYWNRTHGASIIADQKKLLLSPKKVVIIPPEVSYHARISREVDHCFIHFLLLQWPLQWKPTVQSLPFELESQSILEPIILRLQQLDVSETLSLKAFIFKLLSELPTSFWYTRKYSQRLRELLPWMLDRLELHDNNETLAQKVHLTPTAFSRWFKEEVGKSPQRWLDEARINRACDLFHQSSLTIDKVSSLLGYADRFHFSRTFSKIRGVPPGRFRKTTLSA